MLLRKHDTIGMNYSIEVRPQFLDHQIVEMINNQISSKLKFSNKESKILLKKILLFNTGVNFFNKKKLGTPTIQNLIFSERKKLVLRFSNVFARLQYKINFNTNNTSSFLLATDILRDSSKRRLFKTAAINVEKVFLELLNDEKTITLNILDGKFIEESIENIFEIQITKNSSNLKPQNQPYKHNTQQQ